MRSFFLCLCLFLLHSRAYTNDTKHECEEDEIIINVNIYQKEILDQGRTGTCAGHTVAQSYSAFIEKTKTKKVEVSPLLIALHSKVKGTFALIRKNLIKKNELDQSEPAEKRLRGGKFAIFFEDFKKAPICSPQYIEDFLFDLTREKSKDKSLQKTYDFLTFLEKHPQKISLTDIERLNLNFERANTLLEFLKRKKLLLKEQKKIFPHLRRRKKKLRLKNRHLDVLYDFFLEQCGKYEKPKNNLFKNYEVKNYSIPDFSKEDLIEKINQNIRSKASLPIGLSYRVKKLYVEGRQEGHHSSLIIGKICQDHKRYYLIRNSWGGLNLHEQSKASKEFPRYNGDFLVSTQELKKTWAEDYGSIQIIKKIVQ